MHKVTSELSKKPEKRGMSSNSSKCMTLKQVSLTNHSKSNLSRHNTVFKKSSRQHVCIIWNDASLKERAKRVGRISGESLCLPATLVAPPPPRQHLGEPLGKAQEASLWPWVALIPLNAEEWLGMWRGSSQGAGRPLRLSQVPEWVNETVSGPPGSVALLPRWKEAMQETAPSTFMKSPKLW